MGKQPDHLKLWNFCQQAASKLDKIERFWYKQVNPITLEMKKCDRCVMGQLMGEANQYEAIKSYGLNPLAFGYDYSNEITFIEGDMGNNYYWDLLNTYWRKLVRRRQYPNKKW